MKHTPGPWKATVDGFIYREAKEPPYMKLNTGEIIGDYVDFKPGTPDSKLVCAAPELLEAAKKAVRVFEHTASPGDKYLAAIALERAISKAEGK